MADRFRAELLIICPRQPCLGKHSFPHLLNPRQTQRDGERTGVLTRSDLVNAAIVNRQPIDTPVGPLVNHRVVSVAPDDFVSTALLRMTKHNKRRVAVMEDGEFVGVLEDIDLLSFLAGNSQLVAQQVDRASSVADLAQAARKIEPQIRMLRRQGVKIEAVCEIVSDLNQRLHAKLFSLLAPQSIRERGCLIVMGSEGRGEQTFRTDQDNGLILSEFRPGGRSGGVPRRLFPRP